MTTIKNIRPIAAWRPALLAFLLLFVFACNDDEPIDDGCEKWEYEGVTGPDHWVSLCDDYMDCGGMRQSPVNIEGAMIDTSLQPLVMSYAENDSTKIVFNGHTIEFEVESGSTLTLNGAAYKLQQFHFHTKSEHTINDFHSPLELHMVHEDPISKNRAVVGVLIEEGAENVFLSQFIDHLPASTTAPYKSPDHYNPADVLPANKSYFTYAGSLTTPSCDQNVTWFVLSNPIEASDAQILRFEQIMQHNYRPVQSLQGRVIKFFPE